MPTITMRDVARVAGVSIATVSATLSGKAYVSPELQTRVQAAIKTLGYAPDGVARSLKQGSTSLLGLIIPDITNPFYTELVHAVQARAHAAGYAVLLCDSNNDAHKEQEYLHLLRTNRVAGTLICPSHTPEHVETLRARQDPTPIVLVDNAPADLPLDAVVLDNLAAGYMATAHILSYAHTAVGTVAGPQHTLPGSERLAGYYQALRDYHLAPDPRFVRYGNFRADDGYRACQELFALPSPPTALFVANNHMLVGVMQALADLLLCCPDDVSIVSIDDFPWARAFTPKLTTVRQPVDSMAELALDRLLERIAQAQREPLRHVLTPALVVRESCRRRRP
jgi:LacI family transcriptional regulator